MVELENSTSSCIDMVHSSLDYTTFNSEQSWRGDLAGLKYEVASEDHIELEGSDPHCVVERMRIPETPPSANECWSSRSPSSSESAESFRSIDIHSPSRRDSQYTELQISPSDSVCPRSFDSLPSLLDTSFELNPIQLLTPPSTFSWDYPNQQPPSASHSPQNNWQTPLKHYTLPLQNAVGTTSQNERISTSLPNSVNQRPKSLEFRGLAESPLPAEQPLSFTTLNNTSTLEEQLASADIAWIDALELPNLCLEEVDRILTATSCLRTPDREISPPFPTLDDIARTTPTLEVNVEKLSKPHAKSNTPPIVSTHLDATPHTDSLAELVSPRLKRLLLPRETDPTDSNQSHNVETLIDSDGTLTCSEAEYYCERMKLRRKKKRLSSRNHCRHRRLQTCSTDIWDSEQESENEDALASYNMKRNKILRLCPHPDRQQREKVPSVRRLKNAQADADLKPWWPKEAFILTSCDNLSNSRSNCVVQSDPVEEPCYSDIDRQTVDSGHCTGVESIDSQPVKFPLGKKSKTKHHRRNPPCTPVRERRRRKQMELWQFILCRLQTASQSAFEWVNPATGVFRIRDTHAAAREWGKYRNNSRMDYEKMARAMRFYYKDSILRKARQQLHFQFAMTYVQWSEQFYGPP